MKTFTKGQRVHVVEPDGIALGHYVGPAKSSNEHKVKMHTGPHNYTLIKDGVIFGNYTRAKKAILSDSFRSQHFRQTARS